MPKFFHRAAAGKEINDVACSCTALVREVGESTSGSSSPGIAHGIASALPRYCPWQTAALVEPRCWGAGVLPPALCSTHHLCE